MSTSNTAESEGQYLVALFEAQQRVRPAAKKARNTHHDYTYATNQEIVDRAKEALHHAKLMVVPAPPPSMTYQPLEGGPEKHGGAIGNMTFVYQIIHVPSRHRELVSHTLAIVPTAGKGTGWARPADKAMLAAETEARGYCMLSLLMIPRRDPNEIPARRDAPEDDGRNGDATRSDFPRLTPQEAIAKLAAASLLSDAAKIFQQARAHIAQNPEEGEDAARGVEEAFAKAAERIIGGFTQATQIEKARGLFLKVPIAAAYKRALADELAAAEKKMGAKR